MKRFLIVNSADMIRNNIGYSQMAECEKEILSSQDMLCDFQYTGFKLEFIGVKRTGKISVEIQFKFVASLPF